MARLDILNNFFTYMSGITIGLLAQQETGLCSPSRRPVCVASSDREKQSLRWQQVSSRKSISGGPGGGCKTYHDLALGVTQKHSSCITVVKKYISEPGQI